jgi:hypothetical protein
MGFRAFGIRVGAMDRSEFLGDARGATALADVLMACPTATAADELALLRQGYAAINRAVMSNPGVFAQLAPAAKFEAMLACGALESAAIALIPRRAGFMLSRGGDGRHIGSVFMIECGEHTVVGNTAALTVMAAALSACHALLQGHSPHGGSLH